MVNRAPLAGIITTFIFLSGFTMGFFWDSMRSNAIEQELNRLSVYSTSLLIESQLIDTTTCDAFWPILKDALGDLGDSMKTYVSYTESSVSNIDYSNLLYKKYLLSNIRYWMFTEKYKQTCGWNVSTVIFFFDDDCDGECDAMSTRLDYLKRKYDNDVLIFPINLWLAQDDPVANSLAILYNVTELPKLVIDGKVFGALELNDLEALVCSTVNCDKY
ncbi:MAG: hypothetical protein GOV00_01780 [Candidatus Altiarchaeota archaeon]|nr:hypothetical protein [Candidatus Altiarchaeota archaeon]